MTAPSRTGALCEGDSGSQELRVDSTVVEANVHHPTDSRLLGDGVLW
jgi:hypothetical protein